MVILTCTPEQPPSMMTDECYIFQHLGCGKCAWAKQSEWMCGEDYWQGFKETGTGSLLGGDGPSEWGLGCAKKTHVQWKETPRGNVQHCGFFRRIAKVKVKENMIKFGKIEVLSVTRGSNKPNLKTNPNPKPKTNPKANPKRKVTTRTNLTTQTPLWWSISARDVVRLAGTCLAWLDGATL